MKTLLQITCVALIGFCGCRPRGSVTELRDVDLIRLWADENLVARLDVPGTTLLSSFDPAGGNEDYNHPLREGPPGWVVLADLKGPGYVSRFWFTGAESGQHRVRWYFDGERNPSLDLTLEEFCGGREPWRPPFANYENYCWYNLVPIPFRRRLVIMTQKGATKPGGWPRLFHQINFTTLPPGKTISSFKGEYSREALAELAALRGRWEAGGGAPDPHLPVWQETRTVGPSETAEFALAVGPAIVRELRAAVTAQEKRHRNAGLRDLSLRIYWNDASEPSIEVPLDDFFGQMWRRLQYQSMFFGYTNGWMICRFPMPFERSMRIEVTNSSSEAFEIQMQARFEPLESWSAHLGYLHSQWFSTRPQEVGRPHPIAQIPGRGKFVGCLLGVMSLDRSWWVLEGDEEMWLDGSRVWRGTGLEDYFNGGWYYQNVLARPVHGVPFKAFFRVTQYRLHLLDAPTFEKSFAMHFERGPDHASHAHMESVAWLYLAQPTALRSPAESLKSRPPQDPLTEATVMTELLNYERFDDYEGALDYTTAFLAKYPQFPRAALLRLRKLAYREKLEGFDAVRSEYERFLETETDAEALEQARLLLWFHENPDRGLISLYSSAPARAFLNGQEVVSATKPDRAFVRGVELRRGRHALALFTQWSPYPSWIQAALRTHEGLVTTTPAWKYRYRPDGSWSQLDYDDSAWRVVGGTGVKGPPEEPYIWLEPNGFVDLQSKAIGIRVSDEDWPDKRGFCVLRGYFEY